MKVIQFGKSYDQPILQLIDYVDDILISKEYNWVKHFGMKKIKLL